MMCSHEILHMSPGQHCIILGCELFLLKPRVVRLHLFHGSLNVLDTMMFHPIVGRHWIYGACHMRKGALPRIGVVHPLREEAPVQGDAASVELLYLTQAGEERR